MPERPRIGRIENPEETEPVARGVRPGERAGNPAVDVFNEEENRAREKRRRKKQELDADLEAKRITQQEYDRRLQELGDL